ncbi:ATP-binding protein [Nonomuraea sp. NPDC005983]|uniref:sensor histidine kinase n=1 Tax=Nonomuraea sp. NPDC005983 TaxID=3155595 RepID=UPI0033BEB137
MRLSPGDGLTIGNTGSPVTAEQVPELFEPFRRLHGDRAGSAGLGLSIVAAIVHAHDARITAVPNLGGGLAVTVLFPGGGSGRPGAAEVAGVSS